MRNDYSGLGLEEVLQKVSFYCGLEASKQAIENEEVPFNPLLIEKNIQEVSEALQILNQGNEVEFEGIGDVTPALEKAGKGMCLTPFEIRRCLSFHFSCERLKKVFAHFEELDVLKDYCDSLMLDHRTYREIDCIIDQDGKVKKTASKKLQKLYEMQSETGRLLSEKAKNFVKEHASSLQEEGEFYRNDRLTFLLKNSDKNKYDGYRYGESASKQAAYVEPAEFIDLNNKRITGSEEIEKEIERLLKEASHKIASSADLYVGNYETILTLDIIFAKARFGAVHHGVCGQLKRDGELYLKEVAHPLIPFQKVVSNTYRFPKNYTGIVISGSNTGGKTVSLKVIGLSILMTYLGIPLYAEEAIIPLYDNIFADLEDTQSIQNSLSSFSAHLKKIDTLLKRATEKSLVLIDEIGTGTDPQEAEALSLAVLDRFLEKHIPFVLTTHYEEIKKYAYKKDEILLSAVGFDTEKLMPTYRYLENTLGESNALKIAGRYIDDERLIEEARRYLVEQRSEEQRLLEQLRASLADTQAKELQLSKQLHELSLDKEALQQEREHFLQQQEQEKLKTKEELEDYIRLKKDEADEIVASLRKVKQYSSDLKQKSRQLDVLNSLEVSLPLEDKDIHVGDRVRIKNNERIGKVLSLEKNRAKVDLNGLSVDVKQSELEKLPPIKETPVYKEKKRTRAGVPAEINLIGQRVEEALDLMDKYLDDAFACGRSSVRVIHGYGTGALRSAIRERLKHLSFVKSYKDADFHDGGSAVTLVEFKR